MKKNSINLKKKKNNLFIREKNTTASIRTGIEPSFLIDIVLSEYIE